MIIGSLNIYRCDGAGCETHRVVPVEREAEFEAEWHSGLGHQFCPACKNKIQNQAAIAADDRAAERLRTEVMKHAA